MARQITTEDKGKRVAGEWVSQPPGTRMDGGRVSQEGRWWSNRWWRGHWMKRRTCGIWRDKGGSHRCSGRAGHGGAHDFRPVTRAAIRQQRTTDYRAYLEAQYDSADSATRGTMLNAAGERRGVHPRALWFNGRPGSAKYASEEMRDWLREHDRPMTYAEYHRQTSGSTGLGRMLYG